MPGIIVRFKTDEPVKFKEKGCDIEFAANVEGALYVNDYDQDSYGATNSERVENLGKMIIGKIQVQLSKWSEQDEKAYRKGRDVLAARLDEELMDLGDASEVFLHRFLVVHDVLEMLFHLLAVRDLRQEFVGYFILRFHPVGGLFGVVILQPAVGVRHGYTEIMIHGVAFLGFGIFHFGNIVFLVT